MLLLLFLAAVQQADRLVSYYGAMHRNADTPELFERVSLKLGGIEKNLFLRGAGVVERGEWLTVLTAKTIYPLPQATEWSGTYAPQVSTLNNLSKCCSTGSWLCVAESLQPAEMINLRIFIDADTCAELIKSLPKSIKREDIQHFTVLEPDAGLLLRSLGLNGTHL